MAIFNSYTLSQLLLIFYVLREVPCQKFCTDGPGYLCWYNNFNDRDKICATQGLYCRYSFHPFGTSILGTCFCCRKSSAYPSSIPVSEFPLCPLFSGLVTDFSSFDRKLEPKLTKMPLDVHPSTVASNHIHEIIPVTIEGEDVKYIDISEFSWKKRLETCKLSNGITLKQELWENSWVNETEYWDRFLANQCNPTNNLKSKWYRNDMVYPT